ncbi:hypothetical protein E3P89_02083 [Wallemia ichthyophaga]|uniref:Uncharacterized protein n=1 Tax=Wallemia ichthyophaga TaxID=245174 RepID=A0A4T0I069_WALIC|nr:hypothetical protein E3P95_00704 [Wallemia ichthyophaga]TIB03906.1 hypothetical protein E3P94_00836 [Wallemia ichthyophaga]TIB14047.1 hypothetical protein E3P90_01406 [Wallemia ichthyophaga]TIB15940.1 hypothetical protein E3P93_01157 [Wallemia ichthyophaga]TIB22390.1 hypothetical protein E3P89_02083 [Wallemia ichthyophaga]
MPFEFTTQAARMRDAHPTFNASWARLESVKHLGRSANAENNQKSKRVEIEETNFLSSLFNGKEYGEACCNHAMACSGARHEAVKSILEHSRARNEAIGKPLGLLFAKSRPKRQENVLRLSALKRSCELRGPSRLIFDDCFFMRSVCRECHEQMDALHRNKSGLLSLHEANDRKLCCDVMACTSEKCLRREIHEEETQFVVVNVAKNHAAGMALVSTASERPAALRRKDEFDDESISQDESTDTQDEHVNSEWLDSDDSWEDIE